MQHLIEQSKVKKIIALLVLSLTFNSCFQVSNNDVERKKCPTPEPVQAGVLSEQAK